MLLIVAATSRKKQADRSAAVLAPMLAASRVLVRPGSGALQMIPSALVMRVRPRHGSVFSIGTHLSPDSYTQLRFRPMGARPNPSPNSGPKASELLSPSGPKTDLAATFGMAAAWYSSRLR